MAHIVRRISVITLPNLLIVEKTGRGRKLKEKLNNGALKTHLKNDIGKIKNLFVLSLISKSIL